MNSKKPLPAIVVFAIITTITTFVWIGFEVYRALTREPSPSVDPAVSAELDPSLDTAALSSLVQRIHLEDSEIGQTSFDLNAPIEEVAEEVVEEEVVEEATAEPTPVPTEAPEEENAPAQ